MVGQISYTEEQILFILGQTLANEKRDVILHAYKKKFDKPLSAAQLRYVKTKYGHDPEFGTAIINRKLPTNGGNRKTAKSLPKEEVVQPAQPMEDVPCPTVALPPQPGSSSWDSPSVEFSTLEDLTAHTRSLPDEPIKSPILPSWQAQPQSQHEVFLQHRQQACPGDLSGTYWFQQHTPTAYNTPYGYQPVLHYYNRLLQPSASQKRKREESAASTSSLEERPTSTKGICDVSSWPVTTPEPSQEIEAKRIRLESQVTDVPQIFMATSAQMPINNIMYQAMGGSNMNLFDSVPTARPSTPTNPPTTGDGPNVEGGDNKISPWIKPLEETEAETQPPESMLTALPLQMTGAWNDNDYTNDPSAQRPTPMTTPMPAGAYLTPMSKDPSLAFPDISWKQVFDETDINLQGNHPAGFPPPPQPSDAYELAVDLALDQLIEGALQTPVGDASGRADASVYNRDGKNQENLASTIVTGPQQLEVDDRLGFSNSLEDFDWRVFLPPNEDQSQGPSDQTQSPHYGPLE